MIIFVAVKQVKSVGDEIAFLADASDVDQDYVEGSLNEWDAVAVEEALKIREACGDGTVVAASVGSDFADGALRRCLAMGVDRGIRIEAEVTDPIAIGHALAHVARRESPSLVLCGAQSSDSVQGSTGGALAGLLDLP